MASILHAVSAPSKNPLRGGGTWPLWLPASTPLVQFLVLREDFYRGATSGSFPKTRNELAHGFLLPLLPSFSSQEILYNVFNSASRSIGGSA